MAQSGALILKLWSVIGTRYQFWDHATQYWYWTVQYQYWDSINMGSNIYMLCNPFFFVPYLKMYTIEEIVIAPPKGYESSKGARVIQTIETSYHTIQPSPHWMILHVELTGATHHHTPG